MTVAQPQVKTAGLIPTPVALICGVLLLLTASPIAGAGDRTPARSVEELEQRLRGVLDATGTPGMVGAIVYGDEVVWQGALGVADRDTSRPVTHQTLFRVGSISKTFLSLAVLRLVERGELRLSDPVDALAPEAGVVNPWADTHPVRLVHLLEHTAGLPDFGFRGYALDDPAVTTRRGLELSTTSLRARWRPGTRMAYSNLGPAVAALAVENATGRPVEEVVGREVFGPLGMTTATYFHDDAVAASYKGGRRVPYKHLLRPPGGASATSGDMIRLLRMFNGRGSAGGATLLRPESVARMETPTTTLAAEAGLREGYGLGNETTQVKGFVFQGHGGSVDGFFSRLVYLPDAGRGYFRSINAANTTAIRAIDEAIVAFITKDLPRPKPVDPVEVPAGHLRAFEGTYLPDSVAAVRSPGLFHRLRVATVRTADGRLFLRPSPSSPEVELKPAGGDRFAVGDDPLPSHAFVTSPDGEFLAQTGENTWRRVHPVTAYTPPAALAAGGVAVLTTLLFAPVWVVRRLRGRRARHLSVRVLPLAAAATLVIMAVLLGAPGQEGLARPTGWSVGVCVSSLLFAGLAALSLLNCAIRFRRRREVGRLVWYHSLLASVALVAVTVLFGSVGLIGLRTWVL